MNRYSMLTAPVRVLSADPPWKFGDSLPGETRGASKQYDTLDVRDIIRFPLPPIAENAVLFMWRVSSMQEEALRVIDAWGFKLKTEIVWIKRTSAAPEAKLAFGMGHYTRASHETCLMATRGRFKVSDRAVRSIFDTIELEAPLGEHSQKPEAFYALVERLCFPADEIRTHANAPVELFGRATRPGWHVFGNQVGPENKDYVWTPPAPPAAGSPAPAEDPALAETAAAFEKVQAAQDNAARVAKTVAALDAEKKITVTGGNVQIGDGNKQTIAEAPLSPDAVAFLSENPPIVATPAEPAPVELPDAVAEVVGEHPALTDPAEKERFILLALTQDLVTASEVQKGTEYVWRLLLTRAAEKGLRLTEHGIGSAPPGAPAVQKTDPSTGYVENISALCNALSLKLPTISFPLSDVSKWPLASREQARRWLLGAGEPPTEIVEAVAGGMTKPGSGQPLDGSEHSTGNRLYPAEAPTSPVATSEAPAAADAPAEPPKKRGRPKKPKPCVAGCGTTTDDGGLCPACKTKLGLPAEAPPAPAPAATVAAPAPAPWGDGIVPGVSAHVEPAAPAQAPASGESAWDRATRIAFDALRAEKTAE